VFQDGEGTLQVLPKVLLGAHNVHNPSFKGEKLSVLEFFLVKPVISLKGLPNLLIVVLLEG
jgi:hypothetical protein